MTELLGTIVTPDGVMQLNDDIPLLPGHAFVPSDLEPVVVPDLAALLERFDRARPDGHRSRAADWVVLDDRMNFITNLFRSRHHRTSCSHHRSTPRSWPRRAGHVPAPCPATRARRRPS